jgi:hypothetical protein
MTNQPSEPLEDDKHCQFVKPEGGQCGAFRTHSSAFCNIHSGGIAKLNERRRAQAAKVAELQEEFDFGYFNTRTRKDVQELTEKIINGVLKGAVKREKGAMMAVLLPFAYKMARELEGSVRNSGSIKVTITEKDQSLLLQMDESQMDRYLAANDGLRIQIMEELQLAGKIHISKKEDIIDISAKNITPADVKIPGKELANLSMKTDVPLTQKQVLKLFGKTLADAPDTYRLPPTGPDMSGFGHVFEKDNKGLPVEAQPIPHKWKGDYEMGEIAGMPAQILWFTCRWCQARARNVNKEVCPTPRFEDVSQAYEQRSQD